MPDLTHTSFYQALRAPRSEALEIAQIATDPSIEHEGDAYPPVLTAGNFALHVIRRSDTTPPPINQTDLEAALAKYNLAQRLEKSLLVWTGEAFFEIVALPITADEDVPVTNHGFRITEQGMRVVDDPLRDHGVALLRRADFIRKHLEATTQTTLPPATEATRLTRNAQDQLYK